MVVLLIALGAYLRYYGAFGDALNQWVHPDENRISFATNDINLPSAARVGNCMLDKESLHDKWKCLLVLFEELNPHFFAYGSLPIYAYRFTQLATQSLARNEKLRSLGRINGIFNIGRFYTLLGSVATLVLIFLIGKRVYDIWTGLLALFFLVFTVLHIQLSKFMTVDVILVFFIVLTLHYIMKIPFSGAWKHYVIVGILWGMTLATKLNALLLIVPLGLAHIGYLARSGELGQLVQRVIDVWRSPRHISHGIKRVLYWIYDYGIRRGILLLLEILFIRSFTNLKVHRIIVVALLLLITFIILEPFAIIDFKHFMRSLGEESRWLKGHNPPVFMLSFAGTPKYIFQIEQMVTWSLGIPLGLLALAGVLYMICDLIKRFKYEKLIIISWMLLYLAVVGNLYVKWLRHMLPIIPFMCLAAAVLPVSILSRTKRGSVKAIFIVILVVVSSFTVIYTCAFMDIYKHWNTRKKASMWIYTNVPVGSKVLDEHWDEGLPSPQPGYSPSMYKKKTLQIYEADTQHKWNDIINKLVWADWIFINSKRLYGSTMRLPDRYNLTTNYYKLLFSGHLGYELVKTVTSYPTIFGIEIVDDLAEESFSVYDHPKASIFKKVRKLSPDEMMALIKNPPKEVKKLTLQDILLAREDVELGESKHRFLNLGRLLYSKPDEIDRMEKAEIAEKIITKIPKEKAEKLPRKNNMFIGGKGELPAMFSEPRDIDIDSKGNFYVADFRNHRVQKFDNQGDLVLMWGSHGSKMGQFIDLSGIMVDADDVIWVVDTWNHRIQKFDSSGKFIEGFKGPLGFFAPIDICMDRFGDIYITDKGNNRVQKFTLGGRKFVTSWGEGGEMDGQFKGPMGIAASPNDEIFVADTQNRRIQVFDLSGDFIRSFKLPQSIFDAEDIYISYKKDNLYISDSGSEHIFVTDDNGRLIKVFDGRVLFNSNRGITVDEKGNAYLVDTWNHRIRKIEADKFVEPTNDDIISLFEALTGSAE